MECNIRTQCNGIHVERIKTVGAYMAYLKALFNEFPNDLCKYQGIEDGMNIVSAINEAINIVKKNAILAVQSSFNDVRNDLTMELVKFVIYKNEFGEIISETVKSFFNDQKECVLKLEPDIKSFIDASSAKYVACMKNTLTSHPLTPSKLRTYQNTITASLRTQISSIRTCFLYPYIIWPGSLPIHNATAAKNFNDVGLTLFKNSLNVLNVPK